MAEQSRGRKFVSDLGIYTLSNLGARLINFVLVPVYTYFVQRPADFGYYDLCMTVCFLLYPVVSLRLRDSAVRFLLNTDQGDVEQRTMVISSIIRAFATSVMAWLAMVLLLRAIYGHVPFLGYSALYLVTDMILAVNVQIARGLGKNKFFAAIGIITTILIFVFTLVFLVILDMGIEGIFLSNIVARICAIVITEWHVKSLWQYFRWKLRVMPMVKDVLRYSVPLIPAALCWWVTSASGRFFINHNLGLEMNGLYAVAMRFVSVFDAIAYIFGTAWQETAIRQYGKEGSEQFFSKILTSYVIVLSAVLVIGAFCFKIIYPLLVAQAYHESVNYIYLMGMSATFYALAAFFELGYQCAKETQRTILPVVLMAIINVVANYFMVQWWEMYGICVASCLSYAFLLVYRWFDTKRYFTLSLNRSAIVPMLLTVVSLVPYFYLDNQWLNVLYTLLAAFVLALFVPVEARQMIAEKIVLSCPKIK